MAGIGALSVTAQEDPALDDPGWSDDELTEPTDPLPWEEDTPPDLSEDEESEPAPAPRREGRTICAPEWLIEWEPWYSVEGAWWVGWWYQWCHTNRYGWWRSYDSWFWGPPVVG